MIGYQFTSEFNLKYEHETDTNRISFVVAASANTAIQVQYNNEKTTRHIAKNAEFNSEGNEIEQMKNKFVAKMQSTFKVNGKLYKIV